jgi:arylsulfatase A-like enzyme
MIHRQKPSAGRVSTRRENINSLNFMKKSSVVFVGAFLCLFLSGLKAEETKPASKPNIVVILIDDMGYGDIGCFGSKLNRTPNLDRMASEGMKMTSFYCAPICTASRTQIMTGCYSTRLGMPDVLFPCSAIGINPNEKTIADLLKPLGYATMIVGKWHLGDQPEFLPTRHGFDHYFGLPYSNDMGSELRTEDKLMPPTPLLRDNAVIEAPAIQDTLTARYTDEAVKFITENKDHPFFLYLAHTAVHRPWHPGADFKGKSGNGLYGDWIEEMDGSVGRVLDTLRNLKLDKNTLVIFTSDNGGVFVSPKDGRGPEDTNGIVSNAPLRGWKATTFEGGMRESSIAWWPGKIAPGAVSDAVMSEMDVLPTVVHLAGGEVPTDRKIDGLDIWPVLSGQGQKSPHEALFYWSRDRIDAVRSGPWKLSIHRRFFKKDPTSKSEGIELYNLDEDIGEARNVAAQHPDVVQRLQGLIDAMKKDIGKGKIGTELRKPGRVNNPKPLLLRSAAEYD